MRFRTSGVDLSRVGDRRGRGMAIGGGGLGLVGLVVALLLGMDPFGGGAGSDGLFVEQPGSSSDLAARCSSPEALTRDDDCRAVKVFNEAEDTWETLLGADYRRARLVLFRDGVSTACGTASSRVGPFYCPLDETVYLDLTFFAELRDRFGAGGDFAQAYVVAHEVGHHVQTVVGTSERVRSLQQRQPGQANALSVRLELQADCYAGVWAAASSRDQDGIILEPGDVQEAVTAAAAIGDDRIQEQVTGRTDPESWTHGSSDQRREWLERGLGSGDPRACDTFS